MQDQAMGDFNFQPRIAKVWQIGNQAAVLAIGVPPELVKTGIKKLFLIIDMSVQRPTLLLRDEKPVASEPKGIIADQVRKNLIGARIESILRDQNGSHLLTIAGTEGAWHLLLQNSKPSAITLIDPAQLVRGKMTPQQTFTKRHSFDLAAVFSFESATDVRSDLIKALNSKSSAGIRMHAGESGRAVIPQSQRDLIQSIKRRIRTTKKSLNRLSSEVRSERDVEDALRRAQTFQQNVHLVEPGVAQITLQPADAKDQPITIELDPTKSPGENLDLLFKQYKKDRGAFEHLQKVVTQTRSYMQALQDAVQQLGNQEVDNTTLAKISERCRIPPRQRPTERRHERSEQPIPYRLIKGIDSVEFRVGKGPNENDLLTKSARGNDWWFHVVQGTGSHIIVSSKHAVNGRLPPHIQRQGAVLAIHYSKLRQERAGEVYVTQRQNLRKTKGLRPGLWLVDRSETLFIRYEPSELRTLLGSGDEGDHESA
jgi:predicted ribosome quality control (RQC) complex YloA/Tae2 family protein